MYALAYIKEGKCVIWKAGFRTQMDAKAYADREGWIVEGLPLFVLLYVEMRPP